jgi:nucleotide-binding universal stress UspA family protein
MAYSRIAVGYDGSAAAQYALDWAARQAAASGATVFVLTAWPAGRVRRDADAVLADRMRLHRMQRWGVAQAVAGLPRPPLVAREIVLAEPVTALAHAAAFADMVVVGSDAAEAMRPGSVAAVLARRLSRARRAGPAPVVVVATKDRFERPAVSEDARAA